MVHTFRFEQNTCGPLGLVVHVLYSSKNMHFFNNLKDQMLFKPKKSVFRIKDGDFLHPIAFDIHKSVPVVPLTQSYCGQIWIYGNSLTLYLSECARASLRMLTA